MISGLRCSTTEQLWMIEDVPAWLPTRNHIRRLGESRRHQLAVPALGARSLDVDGAVGPIDGASAIP